VFSQAFIQFTGAKAAKENQEYVIVRLLDSLKTLSLLATGDDNSITDLIPAKPGELATSFNRLQVGGWESSASNFMAFFFFFFNFYFPFFNRTTLQL